MAHIKNAEVVKDTPKRIINITGSSILNISHSQAQCRHLYDGSN